MAIYFCFLGLLLNIILFYGLRFSPPISMFPILFNIISLIIHSIHNKEFVDFMDMQNRKENTLELQEEKIKDYDKNLTQKKLNRVPGGAQPIAKN